MSSTSRKTGAGTDPAGIVAFAAAITVLVLLGGLWSILHLAARFDDRPAPSKNLFELPVDLYKGDAQWTPTATKVAAGVGVVVVLLLVLVFMVVLRRTGRRLPIDKADRHMAQGARLGPLRESEAKKIAKRLGVTSAPGVPIGTTVKGSRTLYRSWEDVATVMAGPRVGKTTSFVIPDILAAPGAVLTTSNKSDVVAATRGYRATVGDVWVFDPQSIVGERPTWWWNPLSYVTDEIKALRLADMFEAASHDPEAKVDPYFNPQGRDLLAYMLLAAAVASQPLTQVYTWLTDPSDETAATYLDDHGYAMHAAAVRGVITKPHEERGGIYGNAQQMASFMLNREAMAWVTPTADADRRQFDPHAFVRSSDTLYSLSKEGQGSAGGLVAALAATICEAGEDLAKTTASGRLDVPVLVVLDEAANVCRWAELPNLYSHYGSRGILISTFLQSWSQGVAVWGLSGMKKLWSAANIKVYAGGVDEVDFLTDLSKAIGDYTNNRPSVSYGKNGRSVSRQDQSELILDVADLRSMPRGRAIVLASGTRAALMRTVPWMNGPHAEAVKSAAAAS